MIAEAGTGQALSRLSPRVRIINVAHRDDLQREVVAELTRLAPIW